MSEYKSRRPENDNNNVEQTQSFTDHQTEKKEQENDSSKKAAKVIAKGAGTYFGGEAGAKAVDLAAKTKAGDKILNKGAELIDKNPALAKTAKKLDESGALDKADQAMNIGAGGKDGAANTGAKAAEKGAQGDAANELSPFGKKNSKNENDEQSNDDDNSEISAETKIDVSKIVSIFIIFAPFIGIFFCIMIFVSVISGNSSEYSIAMGMSQELGENTGGVEYTSSSPEEAEFYVRVREVYEEYQSRGKQIKPIYIASTLVRLNSVDSTYNFDYMTKDKIRELADAMLGDGDVYSVETYKENLENDILKKYFPDSSEEYRKKTAEEILEYVDNYNDAVGNVTTTSCSDAGTCSYKINGFYISGKGNITKNVTYNNIKVRLMESVMYGGVNGKPMSGEELQDFEYYVLGVAYQEIGNNVPDEAFKAQLVAARSYILARPDEVGGWHKPVQEGNNVVLQVAGSTQDQVFCNPDLGCSTDIDGQNGMVYSGLTHRKVVKPPMAQNSRLRTLANETMGEVLVNSQGYIIYTEYVDTVQKQMISLANQGYNYKQILLAIYGSKGANDIVKMSCSTSGSTCSQAVTGDYAGWKQYEGPWTSVRLGNSNETVHSAGCTTLSIAMLVVRSGVETNIQGELNPGTFTQALTAKGIYTSSGAISTWDISSIVPRFKYVGTAYVSGYTKEQKLMTAQNLLNNGYYVIAQVNNHHWTAVDSVNGNTIMMMDPGSKSTDMWAKYGWNNTLRFVYWQVV